MFFAHHKNQVFIALIDPALFSIHPVLFSIQSGFCCVVSLWRVCWKFIACKCGVVAKAFHCFVLLRYYHRWGGRLHCRRGVDCGVTGGRTNNVRCPLRHNM